MKVEKKRIEQQASETRKKFCLHEKKVPNGSTLIGLSIVKGIIKGIKVVSNIVSGAQAQFDPKNKILTITEKTLKLADEGNPRSIFTIAHEIGHAVLGHKMPRNRLNKSGLGFSSDLKKDEHEANIFAAAFLIPEEIANVTNDTTVKEISEEFGVSYQVAEIRLAELQSRWHIQNKIERETPTYIQEKIDRLNSSIGTKTTQPRKFICIDSGDYDSYVPALSKQAKNYPDK